jgi:3-methylfumaryl-CoA hydratase
VQVFRYGAITWNAHRTHYDAEYARTQEGYPGAVMNGGLTTQLLLGAALRRNPGRLLGYKARLLRPLFVGGVARLCGAAPGEGRVRAWDTDADGGLAAAMTLEFGA